MQIKIKSLVFGLSLALNFIVSLLFIIAGSSKTSSLSFFNQGDYLAAAAIVGVPKSQSASVELITINLKPREKAFLQFSVISDKKQANLIFNPLYDPNIVSISKTGFGMEITALRQGNALIQTLANDGIRDVAQVFVSE
ncbi:MAG: hypothetical protein LBV17_03870 [Treponema sp.]|jgi:hypothetical protein|nr:hypothetical protein [Treponema sp.]